MKKIVLMIGIVLCVMLTGCGLITEKVRQHTLK